MKQLGHDVRIYWRKKQPEPSESFAKQLQNKLKEKLSWYLHDPKIIASNIKYIVEEFKILRNEKPDLLISRLETYLISAVVLAKIFDIPLIIEADAPSVYEERMFEYNYYRFPRIPEYIEKKIITCADRTICVSNAAKEYFIRQGIPDDKLAVVTNGVDIKRFNPGVDSREIREQFGLKNVVCVGFVGSFHLWHGIENLSKMIDAVIKEVPSTKFLMVGKGGPMFELFKEFVMERGFSNNVIFTGFVPMKDMPKYISAMDIVLAPYPNIKLFHYSPVKIFEYMASGKPVISTKIGQIKEIIRDGYNGLLCEPNDLDGLVTKLINLIQNARYREYLGKRAFETIKSHHTWRIKAKQWESICMNVIHEHQNAR